MVFQTLTQFSGSDNTRWALSWHSICLYLETVSYISTYTQWKIDQWFANPEGVEMKKISFSDMAIVARGTLNLELNHLKREVLAKILGSL